MSATRTRHPCAGRSALQREAFEAYATGQRPPYRSQVIQALLDAGLIERVGMERLGRDALGVIDVPIYQVPLHHHAQWAQWCAENAGEGVE